MVLTPGIAKSRNQSGVAKICHAGRMQLKVSTVGQAQTHEQMLYLF